MDRLDAELHALYPSESVHGFDPADVAGGRGAFAIARLAGRPVGCGALRVLEPGIGEVKRIFVAADVRGRGLARRILAELESAALGLGLTTLRLETGTRQPDAIRLFESAGYTHIERFGEYAGDPFSVCLEKRIRTG
jgi:GNAT superfamily N-acetyltransferase